ncbi:MAG TPA: peptidylprolyl isomerase [Gemmatimonadota bacterium]|nr:peptidylprolyl isomerase [Gemmatimonadota bacterium]
MTPPFPRIPARTRRIAVRLAAPAMAVLALAGPAGGQVGLSQPRPARPADGLLSRPDLQRLVDAQNARDGGTLVAALSDADPVVRARAAFALASVQDTGAVPPLLASLADPEAAVRADAAFALGLTADSTAEDALLDALESETDPAARAELFDALGRTGGGASLAALATLGAAGDERALLALAIGRYGLRGIHDPRAVERLAGLAADPDPLVAADAAWYFARADTAAWSSSVADLRRALDGLDPKGDAAAEAAIHLLAALGRLDRPEDRDRLVAWLEGAADWRARVAAARALAGFTRDPLVTGRLMGALDDPRLHVAVEAARALSAEDSLDSEVETEIGRRVMTRPQPWQVSVELLPAIAKAGHSRLNLLWLLWLDGNPPRDVTAYSAGLRSLGWGDGREAYLVLQHAATRPEPRISAAALEALAQWWTRGVRTEEVTPERYYAVFDRALRSRDLAAVATVAPVLADSALVALGSVTLLEQVYADLEAPADAEAMAAVREALEEAGAAVPPAPPPSPVRPIDWEYLARHGSRPALRLDTRRGAIELELDAELAPQTAETVLKLAEDGRYDGVEFHRVVPGFVIQGGDVGRGDGWGGPGFSIRSELTRLPYDRGTLGMASAGRDTEGSQYFVTHGMQPHLDGRYTAFGRVVSGMEVVDAILLGDRVERAVVP